MKLYLVQHGDALSEDVDPARPLSERGRGDVERIAARLREAPIRVAAIEHSGKTRARQTAEILARAVGAAVTQRDGIAPNDPVDPIARALAEQSADCMIVGHLPFMGRLVARLCAAREDPPVVRFEPGAVACLERDAGGWALLWLLTPLLA